MILVRHALGEVLRGHRTDQGRTLRDVADTARVSLGYLSEIERGQKEPSSELLFSVCDALGVPLSDVLAETGEHVRVAEHAVGAPSALGSSSVRVMDHTPVTAGRAVDGRPHVRVASPASTAPRGRPVAAAGVHPSSDRSRARRVVLRHELTARTLPLTRLTVSPAGPQDALTVRVPDPQLDLDHTSPSTFARTALPAVRAARLAGAAA